MSRLPARASSSHGCHPSANCLEPLERRALLSAGGEPGGGGYAPPLLLQDVVLAWNKVMLDANAADHSVASPDQGGPTRTSRAFAIVSAAVFDAVNSIHHRYEPYLLELRGYESADLRAAVSVAAHDTLVSLYPQQQSRFDGALTRWLAVIPDGRREQRGVELGRRMAQACIADRVDDGSEAMHMYMPTNEPGHHQPDPYNPTQGFLGPVWGGVTPFVMDDVSHFRAPPPPELDSADYADAYNEVKAYGGDGVTTPTIRTPEQTNVGLFWAYDGTPGLGTPPRLYNQIIRTIAVARGNTVEQNARLLALANLSMGDAGIQSWETKYHYDFWRPIIGIRGGDTDGNADTEADATWSPLGAPFSNGGGTHDNFTPPFPAYVSGHATFGAAAFEAVADFYGTHDIGFTFISDELNGVTTDNQGNVRPRVVRRFDDLDQAIAENAQSRIYLGIHWQFDATEGIAAGRSIADYVGDHVLRPRHGGPADGEAVTTFAAGEEPVSSGVATDVRAGSELLFSETPVL